MPVNKDGFGKFESIRSAFRTYYVEGYKRDDAQRIEGTEAFRHRINDLRRIWKSEIGEEVIYHWSDNERFIKFDNRLQCSNPFYELWTMWVTGENGKKETEYGYNKCHYRYLILLDIISYWEEKELTPYIRNRGILREIGSRMKSLLDAGMNMNELPFENLIPENDGGVRVSDTLSRMSEFTILVEHGILNKIDKGYCFIEQPELDPWLSQLHFFSEICVCGVLGWFMRNKVGYLLEKEDYPFRFKHHYYNWALDSEIVYRLLRAMHQNRKVNMTIYEKNYTAEGNCKSIIPLFLYVSNRSGRQFLIYLFGKRKTIGTIRIDLISRVDIDENSNVDIQSLRKEFKENKAPYMWGVNAGKKTSNISMRVKCDKEIIKTELIKRRRCGTVKVLDDAHCLFEAEVFDSNELLPWLRTHIGRIEDIQFTNDNTNKMWVNDLKELYELYVKDRKLQVQTEKTLQVVAKKEERKTLISREQETYLYSRINSAQYIREIEMLMECQARMYDRDAPSTKMEEILLRTDNLEENAIQSDAFYPITIEEKQFLKAIMLHPYFRLFQSSDEILNNKDVQKQLDDVEPLFTMEDIVYYDRVPKQKEFPSEKDIKIFQKVMEAIKYKRICFITYKGKKDWHEYIPQYVEYSERDDVFRVYFAGEKYGKICILEDIDTIDYPKDILHGRCLEEIPYEEIPRKERYKFEKHKLTISDVSYRCMVIRIEVLNERNTLDRLLMEFSQYRKEVKKRKDGIFEMHIHIPSDEGSDIVNCLLSYGPCVKVVQDKNTNIKIYDQIRKRIIKQCELSQLNQ